MTQIPDLSTPRPKEVAPGVTKTEGQGALQANSFTRLHQQQHPSVKAQNEYVRHLADNQIGWATFVPHNTSGAESPFTFRSLGGQVRTINAFESVPIYFSADKEVIRTSSGTRFSEKRLNPEVLHKEFYYRNLSYAEMVEEAKVILGDKFPKDGVTRGVLVPLLIDSEFGKGSSAENGITANKD